MDQGIAGVIAGVTGLVGAGIGGFATAYGARLGAQKTIEAAQIQVDRQSRAEHHHWVREQRKQACMDISDGYVSFARSSLGYLRMMEMRTDDVDSALLTAMRSDTDNLVMLRGHIQLWGPQELIAATFAMTEAADQLRRALEEWPSVRSSGNQTGMEAHVARCAGLVGVAADARTVFVDGAQRVLGQVV